MSYPLGRPLRLDVSFFSDPDRTVPADPTTVTLDIRKPDMTVESFTLTDAEIVRDSIGVYHYDYTPDLVGSYEPEFVATGDVTAVQPDAFHVRPRFSQVISLSEIRSRLNKSLTVDDDEIQDMLDAALAEYADVVGPLPGTQTEYLNGGTDMLLLSSPNVSEITAAEYDSGDTIIVTDLTVRNGIVRWGYGTTGRFTYGTQNVAVTYTVGALPAHHREAIIADVAGYFAVTQRGAASPAGFPGETDYENAYTPNPLVLFPRIRALAGPSIA